MRFYFITSLKTPLYKIAARCIKERKGYRGRKYQFRWIEDNLFFTKLDDCGTPTNWTLIVNQ